MGMGREITVSTLTGAARTLSTPRGAWLCGEGRPHRALRPQPPELAFGLPKATEPPGETEAAKPGKVTHLQTHG